ncbi:MAG TPA: DegT/DnrJ/EryC1/StrS family aminotransferase [Oculatellaceae cyanobacterium]
MSKLALLGGRAVIDRPLEPYSSIGVEEIEAVDRVMRTGVLSKFVGAWCEDFFGGPAVRELEASWSEKFNVKHSITVNSATSGIFAALGAIGVGPGDEVIVPPYTMSATAMAPLIYGAIPVFVDIEPDTFCLDPAKVLEQITTKTKAILVVNLFGHPAQLQRLRAIADEHHIKLIEDNAQGPLALEQGRYAGAIGHIGIFSLNYHKHIQTGEGGVCVTDDDDLAKRLQMIRNHGENVTEQLGVQDITNLVGYNYRMTELSAAVGIEQLKKAESLVARREEISSYLSEVVGSLRGLTAPAVRANCRHVYYVWAMRYDEKVIGISRELFCRALAAEGFPNSAGYVAPLYRLPVFQRRIAIGSSGFPFNLSDRRYNDGMCPVVERMHEQELIEFHVCSYQINNVQMEKLGEALQKVCANVSDLKNLDEEPNSVKEVIGKGSSQH